ncbi:MAG: hypothetical protein OEX23_12840 [Betaproteobacteria bacterium]|nr:hypothetical protein [Betaproteobacteria bacterium]
MPIDLTAFSRRYFHTLFGRLPKSCVLVFDNYQEASGPSFETLSHEAFSQVPEGVTVIVLSHADPPANLARLVANRVIVPIDAEELRLTRAESDQIALRAAPFDGRVLASLHDRSGGWAAGLVLMIEHVRRFRPHEEAAIASSQEVVLDYFVAEVFSHTPPEHQRLLMLLSALPRITVRLAETISGRADAGELLEHLYRRHLFTDRRPGPTAVYQFHELFRSFLRARALATLSATERAEAASRAGLALEADGYADEAVTLHLESGDWQAAIRLILQQAATLYAQGRWRTLLDWIAALPPSLRESTPWLGYWVGACEVWREGKRASAVLETAFDRFAEAGDRTGQLLSAGVLSRACVHDTCWTALDRWIGALESLLERETESLSPQTRLTGYSRVLYATFIRQPRHARLAEWADKTLASMFAPNLEANDVVMAGFCLMMYYNLTGNTSKQKHVIREVRPLLSDACISPVTLAYWKWSHAGFLLRTGAPREALSAIDESLKLASDHGLAIAKVIGRHRIAYLLTAGELAAAQRDIDALEGSPHVEPYFEFRAWLALQRGALAAAEDEAQTALRIAQDRGRTYYALHDLLLLALVCAEAGAHERALSYLADYRQETAGVDGEFASYQALLVEAYVALQRSDREKCHALLRDALEIGDQQRYCSHWGWCPGMMVRLYTEALDQEMAIGYVRQVIEQHGLLPMSQDVENWPWPVRIYSLGRFEILARGEPVRSASKAQRKPMDLARVLIAAGEGGLSESRLIDTLWPERLESDGRKALDITVHRLRKLLGSDAAVKVVDRAVSLDPHFVWVDAWSLERTLARLTPPLAVAEPPIALLDAAAPQVLKLYRGEFLAGSAEASWQLPMRNRLAGRFQRFALHLGEDWEVRHQWDRAAALYARVIEIDPLAESFYRRQMVCLQAQGRRAEALEVFRRCRQSLSIVLGIAPSSETDQVYRELLSP